MGVTVASRDGERHLRQRDQQEQGKVVGNTVHPGHREEPRLAKGMGDETGGQEAEARSRRAECQSERSGLILSGEDTIRIGAEKLLDFYINLFESKCSGLYRIRPLPCRKPRAWNTVGLQWRTAFMILTVIHISHRSTRPSFYLAASVGWRGKVFLDTNKNS